MRNHLFIGAAVAALVMPAAAYAQETTSAIRGTVTNNGQPVPDATVTITNTGNNAKTVLTTDGGGVFNAAGLQPGGPYTVEVTSASGNKTVTDVYTVLQQSFELPVELAATADDGSGPDIVVRATSIKGAGNTSDGPQTTLTARDVSKIASVNRDVRDVERRDPFAAIDYTNTGDRGGAVSFAGTNPRYNRFTINGVTVGDTFGLNQDASPTNRGPVPFDALSQISVSIAPYDFRQSDFQGGAIDTVLKSGTNEFHGTAFYSQNTDRLSGKKQAGGYTIVIPKFKSETYGATLSGPIWQDKLFFMASGERNVDPRPFSTLSTQIPNLTQGIVDNIVNIAKGTFGITAGSVLTINPRKDEKFVGRIDFTPVDGQRISLSYINAYDLLVSQNNTSTSTTAPSYGLDSNAYALSELLRAGILQWNADWTDKLSTEARVIYKYNKRGQEPLLGRPNGQFIVCDDVSATVGYNGTPQTAPTVTGCSSGAPRVAFGPDNSRQTNQLFFDTWSGQFLARYTAGGHKIQLLAEVTENRTFNNFVQNSLGAYYFDSLADYQARRANTLTYNAIIAPSAAANFHYTKYTVGYQDEWKIGGGLTVTSGARVTLYGMRDRPVLNPYFTTRYGFTNQQTFKGDITFEPRVSFNYSPPSFPVKIRGGVGIFAGGTPDIYLSNSFSNTILTNSLTFTRSSATADTCTGGVPNAICQAALNNVTGNIPASVAAYAADVSGSTTIQYTNTGALAKSWDIPRSLKATGSVEYKLYGFNLGADVYYSKNIEGVTFVDYRSTVIGTLPDGRLRYNTVTAASPNNYDIVVVNSTRGNSIVGVVRVSKNFDFGLDTSLSYTRQRVKDISSATSSTINSNYRYQIFGANPNYPAYGTSDNQIAWAFKYSIGFDHAFFKDYRTVIQLFGETRAGRPFSYTMNDPTTTRSPVFGTNLTSSVGTNLLYVPASTTDPRVSYDNASTQTALDTLINDTELSRYRGSIAAKNISRGRAQTQLDLHLEQEIPTFVGNSRFTVFADINNFANLLNRKWGAQYTFGFPPVVSAVTVQCLTVATPTGTAPAAGTVATSPAQACAQYRYSSPKVPTETIQNNYSFYAVRVGARFTF